MTMLGKVVRENPRSRIERNNGTNPADPGRRTFQAEGRVSK